MSELGVRCSRGYITHEECRKCALNPLHPCGLTPDLLELVRSENSREPDANTFTPSRLLGICDRQRVLKGRSDYYVDINHAWSSIRGQAIHALLERSDPYPGLLQHVREVRLSTQIDAPKGVTLEATGNFYPANFSGKSDFIGILRQEGNILHVKIVDYKTTKYIRADLTDPEMDEYTNKHVLQINMYRWLVTKALPSSLGLDVQVSVDELELLYLDMERTIRFTSAGDITYGRKTYKAIPLYDLGRVQEHIENAIAERASNNQTLPKRLPTFPNHWACKRCPVFKICEELHG